MRPNPFDLYGYKGRHRKQSDTAATVRNVAVTAAVVGAVMSTDMGAAQAMPGQAGEDAWTKLRVCESGNNYSINTGNGYYGAYQFDLSTWRGVGGTGLPSQASAQEQDYRARALYRSRGWSPWACARILGLKDNPIYGQWTAPMSIQVTQKFVVGTKVTVSGTAQPNAYVRVWAKNYGSTGYVSARIVHANAQGRWSTQFTPYGGASYYAESGGVKTAAVTAQGLFKPSMVAPGSTALNAGYRLSGKARPNGQVTVYIKTYYQAHTMAARKVRVDAHGNWWTVWRGTTDFSFTVKGDVVGPTRTVVVATTANPAPKSTVPDATTPESAPTGAPAGDGSGSAAGTPDATAPTATPTATAPTVTPIVVTGSARPNTALTVFIRRSGSTAWSRLAATHTDAHGHWTATVRSSGSYEYFAKSANGQASQIQPISVP
jgi:Transglycosylase-like domain